MSCFKSYYDKNTKPIRCSEDELEAILKSKIAILRGVATADAASLPLYALAIWKDQVDYIELNSNFPARLCDLLEIRVFNNRGEIHLTRGALGENFAGRLICDDMDCVLDIDDNDMSQCPIAEAIGKLPATCLKKPCFYNEVQLLDFSTANKSPKIDGVVGKDCNNAIKIRNYISYDDEGVAQVVDFRIVDFCRAGEGECNGD